MKWWTLVLGCYGFLAGPAMAGERWSAESCKHLQEMKADTYAAQYGPEITQWQLIPILLFQKTHCGIDTQAELIAAQEAAKRVRLERRGASSPPPRQPLHCDTTPKAYGGSYLDCN
jgi:hypothetical protein